MGVITIIFFFKNNVIGDCYRAKIQLNRYYSLTTGTGETVKNLPYLLSINVTHVLNTAECDVNVNPKKYSKEGICYKGFRVNDVPHADISQVSFVVFIRFNLIQE
jgi:hypothetical protein